MWKILCKNILALYRYCEFCVGIFYFASPCICDLKVVLLGRYNAQGLNDDYELLIRVVEGISIYV